MLQTPELTVSYNGNEETIDLTLFSSFDEVRDEVISIFEDGDSEEEFDVSEVEIVYTEDVPEEFIDHNVGTMSGDYLDDSLFNLISEVEDWDEDRVEALLDYCENNHSIEDAASEISSFEDAYQGQYDDMEEFAEQLANETMEIPSHPEYYFDYKKFADDLEMDYWISDNGHVFRNC